MFGGRLKTTMVAPERALPGSPEPRFEVPETHVVLRTPLRGPWPTGTAVLGLGMGCFWGAEELLWQLPGVVTTAVGYQGGYTPNPTYEEVCTGLTGHTEVALVAYDPQVLPHEAVLEMFWTHHDPTQGFRQGNDLGTQYRSAIFWHTPEQGEAARASRDLYQRELSARGFDPITTEILPADEAGPFWYAEGPHQQYLAKNPNGYRCHARTGVDFPRSA